MVSWVLRIFLFPLKSRHFRNSFADATVLIIIYGKYTESGDYFNYMSSTVYNQLKIYL